MKSKNYLTRLAVLLLAITHTGKHEAVASSCTHFDGVYEKYCESEVEHLGNDGLDGAIEGKQKGYLEIISSADCKSITVNDPNYSGTFAKIYLVSGKFQSDMVSVTQTKLPVFHQDKALLSYDLQERKFDYQDSFDHEYQLELVRDQKNRDTLSMSFYHFFKQSSFLGLFVRGTYRAKCELKMTSP